ncbi:hypothetical protein QR680_009492 [Steinernema hermaphroditum]|uniref:GST N-terminal domain-containing protein n=1 Tax=Steinernema hermaphroditum TaxID=289476 RepID=A0AA39IKF9_9BILA|nr:hypothetical protein QR680_009492 [Steinernema hermaphroditum]
MPTYKLYYFQGRGRAEHIRQIFKLTGKEFEDVVPVLEVDGVNIGQTLAISRFLGRQFGKTRGGSSAGYEHEFEQEYTALEIEDLRVRLS